MEWIKCSDKMPEKRGSYLIFSEKGERMDVSYWDSNNEMFGSNCLWLITHWSPLPTPPKRD